MTVHIVCLLWGELAVLTALAGSLIVSHVRHPLAAWRCGVGFMGTTLLLTVLACFGYFGCRTTGSADGWNLQTHLSCGTWLAIDELSALLLPLVGLVHFLTALATGRTKMRRFSLSLSLLSEAISLAIFSCQRADLLTALLCVAALPPLLELRNRQRPQRVYVVHMVLYLALLAVGWWLTTQETGTGKYLACGAVAQSLAVLIRCGSIPAHCWITDWFEHASLGNAVLFVTPLTGVYGAVRLVVPAAPEWTLRTIGIISLLTAVYAASMAVVQKDARRFFAFLFISNASMILVGLELHTSVSLTGAFALWISAALSLSGLGLTLRALEARFGRLSLTRFLGLYEHTPMLAVCFLLTGLASIGFPGTFGFVAAELLIDGAVEASLLVGLMVTLTTAINGIAIMRAYFLLFTGAQHFSTVSLAISPRETLAVLTIAGLILAGGLFPQPVVLSRSAAASAVLKQREAQAGSHKSDIRLSASVVP